jgi:two-component system, OmpR family, phosphate regulon sensor histidine kinase PhoR
LHDEVFEAAENTPVNDRIEPSIGNLIARRFSWRDMVEGALVVPVTTALLGSTALLSNTGPAKARGVAAPFRYDARSRFPARWAFFSMAGPGLVCEYTLAAIMAMYRDREIVLNPLRTDVFSRLVRALNATAVRGLDLVVGGCVLLGMLAMVRALSWPWSIAIVVITAASTVASSFRSRSHSTSRDRRDHVGMEAEDEANMLRSAVSGFTDAVIILDGNLTVLDANEAARHIFSIAQGRHIAQTTRAPELLQAVDAALQGGDVRSMQLQLVSPLDRSFTVRVAPLGSARAAGRPAVLVLLRDMTEQEQLSRMRADFVANASHELRTPLASLKGFIETLQGAAKDDAPAREKFLDIMQEQASRMSRLIDDLLSLSRIEMREHFAPTGIVDLTVVIDEVIAALTAMANDAGIRLEATELDRPADVIGDRDELIQLVQNLLQNAIKYGRRGGRVTVTLAREGANFSLSVRDDGIGIAPHHLPRLTERFYRVSSKDSRERGGTGLGLAIVKHILTRHRGQLRIDSMTGAGSTFTAVLPAAIA